MRNEAFYSTAAQVLPTILIALSLEAQMLANRLRKNVEEACARINELASSPSPGSQWQLEFAESEYERSRRLFERRMGLAWVIGVVFLAGETAAVAVLMLGPTPQVTPRYDLGQVAGVVVAAALAILSIVALVLPLVRLPKAYLLPRPVTWKPPKRDPAWGEPGSPTYEGNLT